MPQSIYFRFQLIVKSLPGIAAITKHSFPKASKKKDELRKKMTRHNVTIGITNIQTNSYCNRRNCLGTISRNISGR